MDLASIRYGKALFNLATEKNELDKYKLAQESISALLKENQDLGNILSNPTILRDDKITLIEKILKTNVPDDFIGLIILLIRRGREGILPELLEHFNDLYLEYKKIAHAKVYSPRPLADEKIAEIRNIISKKIEKIIEIENIINTDIIAGFIVEVEGFLFDASVKTRLANVKKQLLTVNL